MIVTLENMTADKWSKLSPLDREQSRDLSDLTHQLIGYEGYRVEVVDNRGERRRFNVGRSTGWRPCHLEVHNARSMGGGPADKNYQSVRVLRKIR
jgi:hypothetical protein